MGDLAELIERLKALSGPDREVDAHIHAMAVGGRVHWIGDSEAVIERPIDGMWIRNVLPLRSRKIPAYTASLDAAVALVERQLPGVFYHLAKGKLSGTEPLFAAQLLFGSDQVLGEGDGPSLPIALLLALLSSLSSGDRE